MRDARDVIGDGEQHFVRRPKRRFRARKTKSTTCVYARVRYGIIALELELELQETSTIGLWNKAASCLLLLFGNVVRNIVRWSWDTLFAGA